MKKSAIVARNIRWAFAYQFVTLLLGFITPRFIVLTYGSEVNGLQTSIMQILNILALLQAGAVSASVYLLYKPFSQSDYNEVSRVMFSTIVYFKKISLVFLVLMTAAAGFFCISIEGTITKPELFISFFILGVKTAMDLFFCSKYVTIFTADQNKSIISIARLIEKVVYYVLFYYAVSKKQYFIWLYVYLVFGCIAKIVFYKSVFSRKYGAKIHLCKGMKYEPITGKNYSMINEISHSVVVSSITVILSFMYGLQSSSVFSVYNLVFTLLSMIGIVIFDSFSSSFGHLTAEGDTDRINYVFRMFSTGFNLINTILYICAAYLIVPFVRLYTKGMTDAEYINPFLGVMIVLFGVCYTYRIPYNILVSSNGLFKETGIQPLVFMIISIVFSILLGLIRMELILIGPIIFYLANYMYQKIKIQKILPDLDIRGQWDQIIISICGVLIASTISRYTTSMMNPTFPSFILEGVICFIIVSLFSVALYSIKNYNSIKGIVIYSISFFTQRK